MPKKPKVQQAGDGQMIRCRVRVSPNEEQIKMQAEFNARGGVGLRDVKDLVPRYDHA